MDDVNYRFFSGNRRRDVLRCLSLIAAVWLCALPMSCGAIELSLPGFGSSDAPVGSADWWDDKKDEAIFEPGKGYSVPGVSGYFDAQGRPLDRAVDRAELSKTTRGILPDFDTKSTVERVRSAVGLGPNQTLAKQSMEEAEQLFQEKKYRRAAKKYSEAASRWPGSLTAQDALFMVGECYFFLDKYTDARDAYNDLVAKHPNTRHLDRLVEREWVIGQYWENEHFEKSVKVPLAPNPFDRTRPGFDTIGSAIKIYENIRMNDPTGPRADDAIMATAGIYFRLGRYGEADYHYNLIRQEYPRSEFQFEAHLLGLQSKIRHYQGPDYDGQAIEDAKEMLRRIKRLFGNRLSAEERERLRETEAELNRELALRLKNMAEYYDEGEHFASARFYYQLLAKEFPETPLGKQAETRLADLSDKPDSPETRFAWFVDLFPENRERTRVADIPTRDEAATRLAETAEEGDDVGNR